MTVDEQQPVATEPLTFDQVLERVKQDWEQSQKELQEVQILIRQSSAEVETLAQRNTQVANKIHQMEGILETIPRQDIMEIYTAAQEAKMRLFMMRGQMEQLQGKREYLDRHVAVLQQVLEVAGQTGIGGGVIGVGGQETPGKGSSIVRIINAQEGERQHLARLMHDGPAQSLTNLILRAEICERLFDKDPVRARTELTNLKDSVTTTFQKMREFIFDLRPMMLDDLGLNATLKRYVQDFQAKSGLACNLTATGREQRMPMHTEVTVFRVIQGLLSNVHQHANATHVNIILDSTSDSLSASIEDDGCGFDLAEAMANGRQRKALGIISMIDQVKMLGGDIHFDSSPGRGTMVHLHLPI
jgi:two-component system sensor histidine kinase DegS